MSRTVRSAQLSKRFGTPRGKRVAFGATAMRSAVSWIGAALLLSCSADGEQAVGCQNLPIYDVSKPIDAGLRAEIDQAAAKGCITKPGNATPAQAAK